MRKVASYLHAMKVNIDVEKDQGWRDYATKEGIERNIHREPLLICSLVSCVIKKIERKR